VAEPGALCGKWWKARKSILYATIKHTLNFVVRVSSGRMSCGRDAFCQGDQHVSARGPTLRRAMPGDDNEDEQATAIIGTRGFERPPDREVRTSLSDEATGKAPDKRSVVIQSGALRGRSLALRAESAELCRRAAETYEQALHESRRANAILFAIRERTTHPIAAADTLAVEDAELPAT
jgi:hypothetical protein